MRDQYINPTSAFINVLGKLMNYGRVQEVRGSKTLEITSKTVKILNPEQRCIIIPGRNDNIFAKVAETLWMLAGRNDIDWLSYYLPRAKDFSDDGKTWRGAYGPRLRNWNGANYKADQLANVIQLLNRDPQTRQAVISIWDPSEDLLPTKDVPCNNWIQFMIRTEPGLASDGYSSRRMLHMNVVQRSSDWMWGFSGIDLFAWSVLHQMMAYWTDTFVGNLTWFIGSLHIYERHWDRAKTLLQNWASNPSSIYSWNILPPKFETSFDLTNEVIQIILKPEAAEYPASHVFTVNGSEGLLPVFSQMLWLYHYHKDIQEGIPGKTVEGLAGALEQMHTCDLKIAALEYFSRTYGQELHKNIILAPVENAILLAMYG